MIVGQKLMNEIIESIELEIGRKLTIEELTIASKAGRKGLLKGEKYANGDLFIEQFNKSNS